MDPNSFPILNAPAPIAPFDMVVAVSQDAVNSSLKYDYGAGLFPTTFNAVTGSDPTDPDSSIVAKMFAPTVALVGQSGGTELNFKLNFRSGNFMYYGGTPHHPIQQNVPIDNTWSVEFNVSMSSTSIAKLPPAVQSKISLTDYSIQQLFVDFTTAKLDSYVSSNTPGLTDPSGLTAFSDCIKTYLTTVGQNGGNILGYALTANDTSKYPDPTFPPTSAKFQILPAYDAQGNIQATSGSNAIGFLNMTGQGTAMPTQILQPTASMIPPTTASGTMVVCKPNFWDSYLVPKTQSFHRSLLNKLNLAVAYLYYNGSEPSPLPWLVTSKDPNADQNTFDTTNAWGQAVTANPPMWMHSIPSETYYVPNDRECISSVVSTMKPGGIGSNSIVISGFASCMISAQSPHYCLAQIFLTPTYTLSLEPDAQGLLNVSVTCSQNSVSILQWKMSGGGTISVGPFQFPDPSVHINEVPVSPDLLSALTENVDLASLGTDLAAALNTTNSFVLAGARTFSYSSAIGFGLEGDLFAGLFYKDG